MVRLGVVRRGVEQTLSRVPIDFGGGCSVAKATLMADLILTHRLRRTIDLGVYRGRSFLPQAWAHRRAGDGVVIGVDPYSRHEAEEHDHAVLATEISAFVAATDWDELYLQVEQERGRAGFSDYSELLRSTSAAAVDALAARGPFGLIHIDGNHDTQAVVADVHAYLPLLAPGNGFLVLDDISWPSVRPAVDLVAAQMHLIYARVDSLNDYAVFWNGKGRRRLARLRSRTGAAGSS